MTQIDEPGRNVVPPKSRRHIKMVIPAAQVDTDANGQVTVLIPYLRNVCGVKVDLQPIDWQIPT